MHRVLALLLIPALIATSSTASWLHTHAYHDHDHPEHHHGVSAHAHDHHAVPAHPDDGLAHLEACDPGGHAVPVAFVCASAPQFHPVDIEISAPALPPTEPQIARAIRHTDVRVHGPPDRRQVSPRAPPLIAHL